MNYRPRNDFCLLRIVNKGMVRGIAMPDAAAAGKETVVVAMGPLVEDLAVGDVVHAIGTPGQDVVVLPGSRDLILTKQANIVMVVEKGAQ